MEKEKLKNYYLDNLKLEANYYCDKQIKGKYI